MAEGLLLDQEWVALIKEAKNLGISIEEIREFLQSGKMNLGNFESDV
ncbi:DNA-binding anti-repressor SinI [Bacillus aerolatus]|uniref:DNA-binding anti-repressor SinI n=1 Tax=Bacillus aerolatus TaxID=2653354 RepID=A0A6I1FKS7_9BACI|nr:anti-repressor SinI family protein [Bacillus aerolatus]KAB7707344.1 DNA-binding anti-repressor SinI [Bacillus aerolatus]